MLVWWLVLCLQVARWNGIKYHDGCTDPASRLDRPHPPSHPLPALTAALFAGDWSPSGLGVGSNTMMDAPIQPEGWTAPIPPPTHCVPSPSCCLQVLGAHPGWEWDQLLPCAHRSGLLAGPPPPPPTACPHRRVVCRCLDDVNQRGSEMAMRHCVQCWHPSK